MIQMLEDKQVQLLQLTVRLWPTMEWSQGLFILQRGVLVFMTMSFNLPPVDSYNHHQPHAASSVHVSVEAKMLVPGADDPASELWPGLRQQHKLLLLLRQFQQVSARLRAEWVWVMFDNVRKLQLFLHKLHSQTTLQPRCFLLISLILVYYLRMA